MALYAGISATLFIIVLMAAELNEAANLPADFKTAISIGVGGATAFITLALCLDVQTYVSELTESLDVRITSVVNSLVGLVYGGLFVRFNQPTVEYVVTGGVVVLHAFAVLPYAAPKIKPYVVGGETE
jgi:hypothetical protein